MFVSQRISRDDSVTDFYCRKESLDKWLKETALHADRADTARTFVWLDDSDAVKAYFSLCPHTIQRADLPPKVGRGGLRSIPAIMLAKMALHIDLQGREEKFGKHLLNDALRRCVNAVSGAGGRFIVVDALDSDAESFYLHFGFTATPVASRLVMRSSDAAASL